MIRQAPIRVFKGLLMTLMYALYLAGLLFVVLFVIPALLLFGLFRGQEPERLQNVNRVLFGLWLRCLRLCGLLAVLPAKGRPLERPCVVVANHPGLFDILVLVRNIPRLSLMAKRSLAAFLPLGAVIKCAGYVFSPGNKAASPLASLYASAKMIRRGYRFFIFPEGTRSPVGGLHPFQPGAFLLARLAKVDIQPVLIHNRPPFLPKKAPWYYPPFERSTLSLEFWEPIPPPAKGEEQRAAQELEARYRAALGLP